MLLNIVGLDPSLRNWGIVTVTFDTDSKSVSVKKLSVVRPLLNKGKQVRQNNLDIDSAVQLFEETKRAVQGADAVFVEVPVGSQNSRAAVSYGVCVGVLGALRASDSPFFVITAAEAKAASTGKATASKQETINWAMLKHPEAAWPTVKKNGAVLVNAGLAEHMADALATVYAGLKDPSFKQILPLLIQTNRQIC